MVGSRRKELRNYLLRGCFLASTLGLIAIIAFFTGAFEITVAHIKGIAGPILFMMACDSVVQFIANEKFLGNLFEWIDEKDGEGGAPSIEKAFEAQAEMLRFPILGSGVSLGLWIASGLIGVSLIALTSSVFSARHLITILFAIICGGMVSVVFQYYFYKVIFHRFMADLSEVQSGILDHPDKLIRIDFHTKLMVSIISLIAVSLLYSTIMGYNQAAAALQKRQVQLLLPIGREAAEMRANGKGQEEINRSLLKYTALLGQQIFLFSDTGEIVFGVPNKEVTKELLAGFLDEYKSLFTKMMRISGNYYSRNLPRSNDMMVWESVENNLWIGTVYSQDDTSSILVNYTTIYLVLILATLLFSAWVARLAANDVSGPLRRIVALTEKISTGDLTQDANILSEDELADISSGIGSMINGLRGLIARVGRAAEQVDLVSETIQKSQTSVSEGTHQQARVVEESTLAARNMEQVVSDVTDNIGAMATNSKESIKVIFEMDEVSKEVSENISELSVSVESTTSAIYEMNATIREINESVEALSGASEETAASMMQMDRAIKEVEEKAKQTLDLSEYVSKDALEGVRSVQSTIEGIGRVEEGVREAAEVINQLGKLAEQIGEIVSVINDIADQTNLLALNAAIIAAQAGERGRGFAVVADEIKKLSDRTTVSTKKIRNLISAVQSESQRAVSLMERESQSVEDGVNIAFQAGQALEKIQRSTQRSAEMVRFIAKASEEQASNSMRVTTAVESIAERVALIASAIKEQTRGAEQITAAAEEMKDITPVVRSKAQKQMESGKHVTMAMENINQMISYVQKSQQRQSEQAEKIVNAMDKIKNVCQMNVDSVSKLDDTIKAVSQQSTVLKEEIKKFKLPHEDIELDFGE